LCRRDLETYISAHRLFLQSLTPVPIHNNAPRIVARMANAALRTGVGPMAAVAGAVADEVGTALAEISREVLVENGGDIFCRVCSPRIVALDAGKSPFSYRLGIEIAPQNAPVGICTSSGTRGHSLSFGRTDATCIVATSATLADAVATAVGNIVDCEADIEIALDLAQTIGGVMGAAIVVGEKMGVWGRLKLVEIKS
jgi:ApbE superfamily uncharacterized protein (UPF0280 family)